MRKLIVLCSALVLSFASAVAFPHDGSVLLTDAGGTIVGVGRVVAGTTFELELLAGFEGAVRVIFVSDGGIVVHEASVLGGVVSIGGVDLAVLLVGAGFESVRLAPAAVLAGTAGPDPRSALGRDNASERGQERAGDRPDGRAGQGAGNGAAGDDAGADQRDEAPALGEAETTFPPSERPVQPPAARGVP